MDVSGLSTFGVMLVLLTWTLIFGLAGWFILILSAIARSHRDIADRLLTLERAIRDGLRDRRT